MTFFRFFQRFFNCNRRFEDRPRIVGPRYRVPDPADWWSMHIVNGKISFKFPNCESCVSPLREMLSDFRGEDPEKLMNWLNSISVSESISDYTEREPVCIGTCTTQNCSLIPENLQRKGSVILWKRIKNTLFTTEDLLTCISSTPLYSNICAQFTDGFVFYLDDTATPVMWSLDVGDSICIGPNEFMRESLYQRMDPNSSKALAIASAKAQEYKTSSYTVLCNLFLPDNVRGGSSVPNVHLFKFVLTYVSDQLFYVHASYIGPVGGLVRTPTQVSIENRNKEEKELKRWEDTYFLPKRDGTEGAEAFEHQEEFLKSECVDQPADIQQHINSNCKDPYRSQLNVIGDEILNTLQSIHGALQELNEDIHSINISSENKRNLNRHKNVIDSLVKTIEVVCNRSLDPEYRLSTNNKIGVQALVKNMKESLKAFLKSYAMSQKSYNSPIKRRNAFLNRNKLSSRWNYLSRNRISPSKIQGDCIFIAQHTPDVSQICINMDEVNMMVVLLLIAEISWETLSSIIPIRIRFDQANSLVHIENVTCNPTYLQTSITKEILKSPSSLSSPNNPDSPSIPSNSPTQATMEGRKNTLQKLCRDYSCTLYETGDITTSSYTIRVSIPFSFLETDTMSRWRNEFSSTKMEKSETSGKSHESMCTKETFTSPSPGEGTCASSESTESSTHEWFLKYEDSHVETYARTSIFLSDGNLGKKKTPLDNTPELPPLKLSPFGTPNTPSISTSTIPEIPSPTNTAKNAHHEQSSLKKMVSRKLSCSTILVVDDTDSVRKYISWFLKNMGAPIIHTSDSSTNTTNKIKSFVESHTWPELITMDLDLGSGSMGGANLTKAIRETEQECFGKERSYIIIITGNRTVKLKDVSGANAILYKPLRPRFEYWKDAFTGFVGKQEKEK